MTKYTKEEAIRIVTSCAEKYRDELANKTLLFVCSGKSKQVTCIELFFYEWNFMHLTGLKVMRREDEAHNQEQDAKNKEIAASDFYERCLAHKLSPDDFEFSDDGTTHLKLDVLPSVLGKNLAANMIGDYSSTKPRLYTEKLTGNTKACVGFVVDQVTGNYVPNTVLKEDIRNNVKDHLRILAAFRKGIQDTEYRELTYMAKKVDWENTVLPDEYSYIKIPTT